MDFSEISINNDYNYHQSVLDNSEYYSGMCLCDIFLIIIIIKICFMLIYFCLFIL